VKNFLKHLLPASLFIARNESFPFGWILVLIITLANIPDLTSIKWSAGTIRWAQLQAQMDGHPTWLSAAFRAGHLAGLELTGALLLSKDKSHDQTSFPLHRIQTTGRPGAIERETFSCGAIPRPISAETPLNYRHA
jgi:hypothetical protein